MLPPVQAPPAMIAVTFALPSESSDFRKLLAKDQDKVAILHTGVGAPICQARIGPFLDRQRFEYVISSGFAGGVVQSLGVGDLLLAENYSDPTLLDAARQLLIAREGQLATADRIIETQAERAEFALQHHALAVDMETESIAQACAARKIPLLSLRVISDTAGAPFPAPPQILFDVERQRTPAVRLAGHLFRHPSAIVRLSHFARQISQARRYLAAALLVVVREVDGPTQGGTA